MRRRMTILLSLFATLAVRAEVLTLRDGSHYRGTVLQQSPTEIVFRIELPGGKSTMTRTFRVANVKSIEADPEHASSGGDAADPLTLSTVHANSMNALSEADATQILREAFELEADGEKAASLRAMSRLVRRTPPRILKILEESALTDQGRILDEWMAKMRVEQAMEAYERGVFTIKHATRYEAGALGRALEALQKERCARKYARRTLEQWAGDGADYTALEDDTRAMVEDARLSAAVLAARLRIDPRVARNKSERTKLESLRSGLSRLASEAATLPGFTRLPRTIVAVAGDDPTAAEAERIAEEEVWARRSAARADSPETSDPESDADAGGAADAEIRFDQPASKKPAGSRPSAGSDGSRHEPRESARDGERSRRSADAARSRGAAEPQEPQEPKETDKHPPTEGKP